MCCGLEGAPQAVFLASKFPTCSLFFSLFFACHSSLFLSCQTLPCRPHCLSHQHHSLLLLPLLPPLLSSTAAITVIVDCRYQLLSASNLATTDTISHCPPPGPPPPPLCHDSREFHLHCMATTMMTMTMMTKRTLSGLQTTCPSHFLVSVGVLAAQQTRPGPWWWQWQMQTVEAKVKNNQQLKSKKMAAKTTTEVWRQPLLYDCNAAMATATWQQ